MSEGKWAKGEWMALGPDDEPYGDITIRCNGERIARLWQDDAPVPEFNARQRANAQLMASALPLYDALELMHDAIMDVIRDFRLEWLPEEIEVPLAEARAALARARGES